MKKIFIFFIIISLLNLSIKVDLIFAQNNEQDNQNKVDFSSYKLRCEPPQYIKIEELEAATETVEYISEFENFAGFEEKPPSFLEELIRGVITGLAMDLVGSFVEGLFGKVPVGAKEVNADIRNSIKESTKNVLASIKASIQLAIKDAIEYFKFKLINKINDLIYNKILGNFIKDINAYRNFRLFLAQQKALTRILNKYKNLQCIPEELKGCLDGILGNILLSGRNILSESENSGKLIRYFDSFIKYQKINILEKRVCEPEEEILVYKDLGLENPISETEEEGSVYALNSKPNKLIAKVEGKSTNVFANIFKIINPKNLVAQFYTNQNLSMSNIIYFDINEIINREIHSRNCSWLLSSDFANILRELDKEKEKLDIESSQPGGLVFKPKSECIKTWSEVEKEELTRQINEAMDRGDEKKADELYRKLAEVDKRIEQEKNITGEDPRCAISGPTISSPSDYEKLKEQILTSPLDFFKSQERAATVLASFVRTWIATKLFNIIDKGFASLESRKSKNEIITDIKNAYSSQRIENICKKTEVLSVKGFSDMCKQTLQSQGKTITDLMTSDIKNESSKLVKILSSFQNISDKLNENNATITNLLQEIENNNYRDKISESNLGSLYNLQENNNTLVSELNSIIGSLDQASSTLSDLSKITLELRNATITNLENQIASTTAEIERLNKEVEQTFNEFNRKISEIFDKFSYAYGSKISQFFEDYLDLEKGGISNFPLEYIFVNGDMVGENPNYTLCSPSLGNREKLSFFSDFYPTHILNCLRGKSYEEIKSRFENSTLDIDFYYYKTRINGSSDARISTYFIVHDLIYIFYSLYNSPAKKSGIQSESFLASINNLLTKLTAQNVLSEKISQEIDRIYDYFDSLNNYASSTIKYAKDKGIYDYEIGIAKKNKSLNQAEGKAIILRLGETLEFIYQLSQGYKEAIEIIKNRSSQDIEFWNKLQKLNELKAKLEELNKQLDKEKGKIWDEYLSKLSNEEINQISSVLENNIDKINDIMDREYELCKSYNEIVQKIEDEINSSISQSQSQQEEESLPQEEPTSQIQKESRISLIKRIFEITKNLFASIFNVFNIFKPKRIIIK